MRLVDGLLAGAIIGGAWWYARREQRANRRIPVSDATLAELARLRAQAAESHDRWLEKGATAPAAKDGPVSAPPPPPQPGKPAGLSRRFDDLFARHGHGIPVAFLRALAAAESGMNPNDRLGLINVVPVALADYNRRHPETPVKPEELTDPATSIRVAVDILRAVIDSYRRFHHDVPNLREDWNNPRFVELLTTGWNAGFSQAQGVGRVVNFLKKPGSIVDRSDITIDRVFDAAWTAGATRHLSNPRKLAYSKGVAAAYSRESKRDARDGVRAR